MDQIQITDLEIGIPSIVILSILAFLSFLSWAIIFYKYVQLNFLQRENQTFVHRFESKNKITEITETAKKHPKSSAAKLFLKLFKEYYSVKQNFDTSSNKSGQSSADIDLLSRLLEKVSAQEFILFTQNSEKYLSTLATISSSAPFIGLLGTVIGITQTFRAIAISGNTSLSVVAPGLAEALIATGVGIFTSLPALIAYNYFRNKVRLLKNQLQIFDNRIIGVILKNFRVE